MAKSLFIYNRAKGLLLNLPLVRRMSLLSLIKKFVEVTNLIPFSGQMYRDCCRCCKCYMHVHKPTHTLNTTYTDISTSKRNLVTWNPHFPMDVGSSVRWLKSSLSKANAFSSPRKGKRVTYVKDR